MRKVEILHTGNPPDIGYFHQFNTNGAVVELIDGTFQIIPASYIRFLDSPEDELLHNTANAIIQGLAQRNGWYWQGGGINENLTGFLPSEYAKMYSELLLELKKQKP